MASYLDENGLLYFWQKIKTVFALKTEIPSPGTTAPKMDGTSATGTSAKFARADHVHPSDTSRAPLASPALTGTPTAPTATAGTNSTQIATTAFVKAAIDNLETGVTGVKGASEATYRTGNVSISAADIGAATPTAVSNALAEAKQYTDGRVVGLYKYKGSVQNASALPSDPTTGDVYNIESASIYGGAGANVAWDGTTWDALGEIFSITSIANADIDTIVAS